MTNEKCICHLKTNFSIVIFKANKKFRSLWHIELLLKIITTITSLLLIIKCVISLEVSSKLPPMFIWYITGLSYIKKLHFSCIYLFFGKTERKPSYVQLAYLSKKVFEIPSNFGAANSIQIKHFTIKSEEKSVSARLSLISNVHIN